MDDRITGLVAAAFTPMRADGALDLARVEPMVEHLVHHGVRGIFVCGSTGEGLSLSGDERRDVAQAYVTAAAGRLPVIIHVGHDALGEARDLAAHAAAIGADAMAAIPPMYYRPVALRPLLRWLGRIADAAPDLPLYFYHIPRLTGVEVDVVALLRAARTEVPSLRGVKYSAPSLDELQSCCALGFNMLFGADELLLAGLVAGADGAVGSTYNFAAPVFTQVIDAFERGDLAAARAAQAKAVDIVRAILRHPAHPALKATMALAGVDCGPPRLPLEPLDDDAKRVLERDLRSAGLFEMP